MTNLSECADQLEEVVASLRQFGEGDGFWRRVAHERSETIGRLGVELDRVKQALDRERDESVTGSLAETAVVFHGRHMDSKARLEHEQEANARLLKTIDEVCRERDDLSRRLSDIVDFVLGGDKPSDEGVEFDPEPGQCWRSINKGYIYRQVDNQVLLWGPSSDTALHGRQWVETVFESLRNLEDHIGDLEPVENPESNA